MGSDYSPNLFLSLETILEESEKYLNSLSLETILEESEKYLNSLSAYFRVFKTAKKEILSILNSHGPYNKHYSNEIDDIEKIWKKK